MQVGDVGDVLVTAVKEVVSVGVMVDATKVAMAIEVIAVVKEAVIAGDVDGRIGQVTAKGLVAVVCESREDGRGASCR